MLNDRRAEEIFYKDPEITRQAGEAVESFREDLDGEEGVESFRDDSTGGGGYRKLQR